VRFIIQFTCCIGCLWELLTAGGPCSMSAAVQALAALACCAVAHSTWRWNLSPARYRIGVRALFRRSPRPLGSAENQPAKRLVAWVVLKTPPTPVVSVCSGESRAAFLIPTPHWRLAIELLRSDPGRWRRTETPPLNHGCRNPLPEMMEGWVPTWHQPSLEPPRCSRYTLACATEFSIIDSRARTAIVHEQRTTKMDPQCLPRWQGFLFVGHQESRPPRLIGP